MLNIRWALALLWAPLLCAQTGVAGHWEGVFKPEGREIGISVDLAQNDKGVWIGSMGVPAQNMTGLVVKDLAVNGKSVKFMAVELMMSTVDLTLGADGKLTGTISNPRASALPIAFERKGDAKVQLPPTSPAVSKDLEGEWSGALQAPGGNEMQVTIRFKNQPDNTVLATIDVPATNAAAMPLNDVKQTGDKVEFGVKIANANFEGSFNKEKTEIAGKLVHDEQSMPLVLKKK